MTIIDDEKRQQEQASSTSTSTPYIIPRSPPPKFQSEASSSILQRSSSHSHHHPPSCHTNKPHFDDPRQARGYGFTYPELIQYTYHLLAIASILIFSAFVVKTFEALSLSNSLAFQALGAANEANNQLGLLLTELQKGNQNNHASNLLALAEACKPPSPFDSSACQTVLSALPSIMASVFLADFGNITNTSFPTNTSSSANNYTVTSTFAISSTVQTSYFSTSGSVTTTVTIVTPPSTSTALPEAGNLSASGSGTSSYMQNPGAVPFGIIVGGIGAVVILLGVVGGIVYERNERVRWRKDRYQKLHIDQ